MCVRAFAFAVLFGLCGCDDSSVAVCFSTSDHFCNLAAAPVADAGPDQDAVAGEIVQLDGSDSHSGLGASLTYAWTQTGGTSVALVDANRAKASFVAPDVATDALLTFRLTVVDSASNADSSDTRVTVAPVSPVMAALQLFDGSLRPSAQWQQNAGDCPSATDALPADAAAAQLGLWLAGRSLALVKGLDRNDPSEWLDFVRVMVTERPGVTEGTAGQLESFGFVLFASALGERDPALQQAITTRLASAQMLDDPAALLMGRSEVTDIDGIAIETGVDSDAAITRAIEQLRTSRSACITGSQALPMTAAGLRVIADAAARE